MRKTKTADKEIRHTIWLGLFVTVGLILLIVGVYFIGSKKNLFRSTFRVIAAFKDVNGLQNGDAVRLRGITVGTVQSITLLNDSDIAVEIEFQKSMQPFIKKNARASITTDGLMGNKIITIRNDSIASGAIQEHDTLKAVPPIDMEDVARKLKISNDKMSLLFTNLAEITDRIKKGKGTLGTLLTDTVLSKELKHGVKDLQEGVSNIHTATEGLKHTIFLRKYFKKHGE